MEAEDRDLLASTPALVRLAVTAYLRTLGWTAGASVKALRFLVSGQAVDALSYEARETLKRLLGVSDIEQRLERIPEAPDPSQPRNGHPPDHRAQLKERGAELLARSATVEEEDEAHPAYERILTSLAPDEARILRLIAIEGARAAVDVRTWRPLDVGSELVEPGLTMIGEQAGVRYRDRVPAYLNNLHRLGLVWFSREPIDDLSAYQVLEAQPEVQKAMDKAGRGRTVRRSVHMTPFGRDFCEVCLPLDTAGFLALKDEIADSRIRR
ncbi:MAG: hypothetical protein QOI80_2532 [Solirubrobacteraceae bacterium]|jgi:hypothetical protein|nr:hypothetical protein [Solirubrobacteraceae bacterium]